MSKLSILVFIQIKAKGLSSYLQEYGFFHRLSAELYLEIFRYDVASFLQFDILRLWLIIFFVSNNRPLPFDLKDSLLNWHHTWQLHCMHLKLNGSSTFSSTGLTTD